MSKIKHILSAIHYTICGTVQLTNSLVMVERIFILCLITILKSEVWTIAHCLGLGHETIVCAVCLSIFLWICDMAGLLRGTVISWWYLPRIWPPVSDMQHYYHARYPTDDRHLAYTPFAKSNGRFFQTQKSTWCPHPIYTMFGRFIGCMLVVIP